MYVIRQTRHYYGSKSTRSLVISDQTGRPMEFKTLHDADNYIDYLNSAVYYTSHNEYGCPEYKAIRTDSLPEYLRIEL